MDFIPVNPLRTPGGDLVSLVRVLGVGKASPIALDAGKKLNNTKVSAQDISVSLAAKLGIGSIFSGSVSYNDHGYYLDAMAFSDQYQERSGPDATVYATRWGVGLRILLRVQALQANLSLNYAVIGAAVQLGYARASYEVQTYGMGAAALSIVLGGLADVGAWR